MANVILQKWEAAELFCRVIDRYEKEEVNIRSKNLLFDFKEPLVSHQKTRFYKDHSNELERIWNKAREKTQTEEIGYAKYLETMNRQIRTFVPVVLPKAVVDVLDKYAKSEDFAYAPRQVINDSGPGAISDSFENSTWNIYYHEEHQKPGQIVKGILRIKPFSGAEITTRLKGYKEAVTYVGGYKLVGDGNFLSLRLKLSRQWKKALQVRIYIGNQDARFIDVALGTYTYYESSMYIGKVIMEPIHDVALAQKAEPEDITAGDTKVPGHVWQFFDKKQSNALSIPGHLTLLEKLKEHFVKQKEK